MRNREPFFERFAYMPRKRRNSYLRLDQALDICRPFDGWQEGHRTCEDEAKEALRGFFSVYRKLTPDKELDAAHFFTAPSTYYSFFSNGLLMREALRKGQYANACHELLTLHFREQLLQKRIYVSLMRLYYLYLEG